MPPRCRLPGFRPGKAPATMVRKKFAEAIRQEALEAIVRDAYKEVVEKHDLKVASQPHVHDLKFEEGKPLTFEIHFELRPTIDLARTSGFRVTRKDAIVTDENVRDQIETIRDQRAAWTPVDGKPMPGDMVNVEISTGDILTGSKARSYPIVLGAGQAIAGIEELIMEAAPGETVERPVKLARRLPRRDSARANEDVKVTPPGRETEIGAGSRRCVRSRGRRLRFARDSDCRRTRRSRGTRKAGCRCRGPAEADRRDHRREPVRSAAQLGQAVRRQLRAGVPDPGRRARDASPPSSARWPSGRFAAIW